MNDEFFLPSEEQLDRILARLSHPGQPLPELPIQDLENSALEVTEPFRTLPYVCYGVGGFSGGYIGLGKRSK